MHLYTPSDQELSTITGVSAVDAPSKTQQERAVRFTRGAWCAGVAALKYTRGLWPNKMNTELNDVVRQGDRPVLLTHRITAVDDEIYGIKNPAAFLDGRPTEIPAFDVETFGRKLPKDEQLIKVHAFRIGSTVLTDESGITYPAIHHMSGDFESEVLGEEVATGSADWAVTLHSVMTITGSKALAEA